MSTIKGGDSGLAWLVTVGVVIVGLVAWKPIKKLISGPKAPPAKTEAERPAQAATISTNGFVEAKGFIIRDKHGKIRYTMVVDDAGNLAQGFYDTNGNTRAETTLMTNGTVRMGLFDTTGKGRFSASVDVEGNAASGLYGPSGTGGVLATVDNQSVTRSALADAAGTTRHELTIAKNGSVGERFWDGSGTMKAATGVTGAGVVFPFMEQAGINPARSIETVERILPR
jgi:hypothetical protein